MNPQKVISGVTLNLWVTLLAVPLWVFSCVPFILNSGWNHYWHKVYQVLNLKLFAVLIAGIFIHELLHAVTWMFLNRKGFTCVKFGFNVEAITPYTHFKEPMKVWKYALGGAMPGIVMGIIPVMGSYFLASPVLNFIGFLFLWAAGGDLIALVMMRKLSRNSLVQDHPDKLGFFVINEEQCSQL